MLLEQSKFNRVGLIPARWGSSRFEGKPLALICGESMIKRTYDRASMSKKLDKVYVVTDDNRIEYHCEIFNIPCIRVDDDCATGTDRCAIASEQIDADIYVNIQGDDNIVVTQLKKKLKIDSFDHEKGKKAKLVKYIVDNDILGMFTRFHGENSENELVSAIKSLYKSDKSALPVTVKTIKGFTLPQLRLFLQDFQNDIGIKKDFGRMSKRRLKSHIKRFKYQFSK